MAIAKGSGPDPLSSDTCFSYEKPNFVMALSFSKSYLSLECHWHFSVLKYRTYLAGPFRSVLILSAEELKSERNFLF